MHIRTKTTSIYTAVLSALLVIQLIWASPAFASTTANIYLSPTAQTVTKGNTFTVAVNISTATEINEANVNLSYPSSQIAFQDVSYSGSAFGTRTDWVGGGGSIRIGRSSASSLTGNLPLAVLTFKVTAAYGNGTISVLNTSTLKNTDKPVDSTYSNATLDFGAAPPDTQPKTITTYTRLASPTDPRFDATPPVLSNIQSKQTGANTVAIGWTTDEPSTSQVEYGLDTHYGLTATEDTLGTAHSVTLHSAFLRPNTLFHYRVSSIDASNNIVHSTDFVFTTKSVQYTVTVIAQDRKPIANARVTLNSQTAYTDDNGKATLSSDAGEQALSVSYHDVRVSKAVAVASDKMDQKDSVKLAARHTYIDSRYIIYPALVLAGLLLGLASRAYLLKYPLLVLRRSKNRFQTMTISSVQLEYGDKNPAHNPYLVKRIFSFWGIWNSFVNVFRRPSKKVSKKIREEVKAAGLAKKPTPPTKK